MSSDAPRSAPLVPEMPVRNALSPLRRRIIAVTPTIASLTSIPARILTAVARRISATPSEIRRPMMTGASFLNFLSSVIDSIMFSSILKRIFITPSVIRSFGAGTSDITTSAPARTPSAIAIVRRALALSRSWNPSSTPPSWSRTLPNFSATSPILSKFFLKELIHRVNATRVPAPIAPTRILPMS